jgi:hypothetical protein
LGSKAVRRSASRKTVNAEIKCSLPVASMAIDTRLKNTASRARSLLTGRSSNVEDCREGDGAQEVEELGGDAEAPQRLGRQDLVGRGCGVATDDELTSDENLAEESENNDDQVQHAADS